jgi:hypothetical protein
MNCECTAFTGRTFNGYRAFMKLSDMLYNRKTQTCSAEFAASAFIDYIETLEKAGQMLLLYSTAVILDGNQYFLF